MTWNIHASRGKYCLIEKKSSFNICNIMLAILFLIPYNQSRLGFFPNDSRSTLFVKIVVH